MRHATSLPTRPFATLKMHKFADIKQLNINDLKICPVIDKTGNHLSTIQKELPNIYNYLQ